MRTGGPVRLRLMRTSSESRLNAKTDALLRRFDGRFVPRERVQYLDDIHDTLYSEEARCHFFCC